MTDRRELLQAAIRAHHAPFCRCQWSSDDFTRTMVSDDCALHGSASDPLEALLDFWEAARDFIRATTMMRRPDGTLRADFSLQRELWKHMKAALARLDVETSA